MIEESGLDEGSEGGLPGTTEQDLGRSVRGGQKSSHNEDEFERVCEIVEGEFSWRSAATDTVWKRKSCLCRTENVKAVTNK